MLLYQAELKTNILRNVVWKKINVNRMYDIINSHLFAFV